MARFQRTWYLRAQLELVGLHLAPIGALGEGLGQQHLALLPQAQPVAGLAQDVVAAALGALLELRGEAVGTLQYGRLEFGDLVH